MDFFNSTVPQSKNCLDHSTQLLTHICTHSDCINKFNIFLCPLCLKSHSISHRENIILWESFFSPNIFEKLNYLIEVQEDKINHASKMSPEFFIELDQAYHQIEMYFKNLVEHSKDRMILKAVTVFYGNQYENIRWSHTRNNAHKIIDYLNKLHEKLRTFELTDDDEYIKFQETVVLKDNLKIFEELNLELNKVKNHVTFTNNSILVNDNIDNSKEEPKLFMATFSKHKKDIENLIHEIESGLVMPIRRKGMSPRKSLPGSPLKQEIDVPEEVMHDHPIDLLKIDLVKRNLSNI